MSESALLEIEMVPITSLAPFPDNPRLGDTEQIMESIRANGFFKPLVISSDGVVLAGNHTYAAAMELGITSVPVVRRPVHSASAAARRIVLADNRTADRAGYDDTALLSLLRSLEDDGLWGTGYDNDDLDDLLARVQEDLSTPLDLSHVGRDPSLAEKFDRYTANGRRMIVLDYDQDTYVTITERLAAIRERYEVTSNAEAVQALLADTC